MKIKKILILVLGLFLLITSLVFAESNCCVSTVTEFCINSEEPILGCETFLPGSCEEHSSCSNTGACVFNDENICEDEVSEARCQGVGREFYLNSECGELSGFRNVCCAFTEGGFPGFAPIPDTECSSRGGVIRGDLLNEFECRSMNQDPSTRKACCVKDDGICSYDFESECLEGIPQPFFCSTLVDQCDPVCEPGHSIAPGPEEFGMQYNLYYRDSCGNLDSDVPVYNCDTFTEMPVLNEAGGWGCVDATCNDVWDNPFTDENHDGILDNDDNFDGRPFRYNGESWCQYQQAKVGPGLDMPGTKHYKHVCDRGIERVIPSVNRDEICVEKLVDTAVGPMREANFLVNNPSQCFSCNNEEDGEACCSSRAGLNVGCSYVPIKDLTNDESVLLMVSEEDYGKIVDILDGRFNVDRGRFLQSLEAIFRGLTLGIYNEPDPVVVNVEEVFVKYFKDGELFHTSENLLNLNYEDLPFNVEPCVDGLCAFNLGNPPSESGNYEVKISGKGNACIAQVCFPIIGCSCVSRKTSSQRFNLGTFNIKQNDGVCVPLVPPSGDEYCSAFNEANINTLLNSEGKVDSFLEFNNYFDFPYNTIGYGGDCDNTEECRNGLLSDFNYSRVGFVVGDNMNSLCASFGDCGIYPNIIGEASAGGFVVGEEGVCTVLDKDDTSPYCLNSVEEIKDIQIVRSENLKSGDSVRPESYLLLFFIPINFIRKKTKDKKLLILFLLGLFVLTSCASGRISEPPELPPSTEFSCNAWEPPEGFNNCDLCNKKRSEGGVLPDVDILSLDENPVYTCNYELCVSLGQGCGFIEGLEGPRCVPDSASEYTDPKIILTDVEYSCNTFDPNTGCNENSHRFENNDISNRNFAELYIEGKLEPLEPLIVNFNTFTTDIEPVGQPMRTLCTYGVNDNSASSPFPPPEGEFRIETDHVLKLTNLVSNVDYDVYIKCSNAVSIEQGEDPQTDIAILHFSTGEKLDITAPIFDSINPLNGQSYAKFEDTTKDVIVYTKGQVDHCRWSNENVLFDDMGVVERVERSTFLAEDDIVDEDGNVVAPAGTEVESIEVLEEISTAFNCIRSNVDDVTNICRTTLDGIVQGENKFWFTCKGINGLTSGPLPEEGYTVIGTEQLNITNVKCYHSLGEDCSTIYDNSFDFSIETAGGAERGNAGCIWRLDDFNFDTFDDPGGLLGVSEYGTLHRERNFIRSTGQYTIKFYCEDIAGNEAESEVTINIERDQTAPRMTKVYKSGDILSVNTDEVTTCYYVNDMALSFEGAPEFSASAGGLSHSTTIDGNFYRIRCVDRFDNYKQTDVYVG